MITTKDIIIDPHETLRKRAEEVKSPISDEDKEILRSLLEYVIASQDDKKAEELGLKPGIGLAEEEKKGYVPRYSKIKVIGYDENDEKVTLMLTDLPAICFQHEIDHLNGIMFYDHINKDNPFDVPEEYERL